MKIKYLVVAAIITFAGVSMASNWKLVFVADKDPKQPKCSIVGSVDTDSWAASGNIVKVWSKIEVGPNKYSCPNESLKTLKTMELIDCDHRSIGNIITIITLWDGKILRSEKDEIKWEHVTPDTFLEAEYNFVCSELKKQRDKQTVL